MSNRKSAPKVDELFENALRDGTLSQDAFEALDVVDIGARIQEGLGVTVDEVRSSEVLLVTMMPDDSGSIQAAGNARAVREGHNLVLDALAACREQDGVLVHTRYLNGKVLFPYRPLSDVVRMNGRNYNPCQGTPLYDQTLVLLGTVLAKSQEFADNGVPVRTVTLVITDGEDLHSTKAGPREVAALARDLLHVENHIIAAMGVDDGKTDFRGVFRSMGIREEWILTPSNSSGDIRRAFQVFSQSAVQAAGPASPSSLKGFSVH